MGTFFEIPRVKKERLTNFLRSKLFFRTLKFEIGSLNSSSKIQLK